MSNIFIYSTSLSIFWWIEKLEENETLNLMRAFFLVISQIVVPIVCTTSILVCYKIHKCVD